MHKGPTIWPLNRDAFDVADVDDAATSFPELNFIVEHVGLPRLEDFCWIAVQEANVYAGMAVAMPLMHTRPRYFAQIMGDCCTGWTRIASCSPSDYAIWQPKWLVEQFVDFQIPEDMQSEYGQLTPDIKRKVLGLNAARLYGLDVPDEGAPAGPGGRRGRRDRVSRGAGVTLTRAALWDALTGVRDPELDEPITELGFVAAADAEGDTARVRLRLPTYFCAPNFAYLMVADARAAVLGCAGCAPRRRRPRRPLRVRADQRGRRRVPGLRGHIRRPGGR